MIKYTEFNEKEVYLTDTIFISKLEWFVSSVSKDW